MSMMALHTAAVVALLWGGALSSSSLPVTFHERPQQLHVFGPASDRVAIVASGDGGWVHLAPTVTEMLTRQGWRVIGIDAKAYLSSESGARGLTPSDVQHDYATLLTLPELRNHRPVLIGISEGGGLSVAAAADPAVKQRIAGVVTLGLGDRNELAWHWRDALIYVTKGVPHEPLLYAAEFIPRVSPAPIAFIRATHDEFVPATESDRLIGLAGAPSRAWTIEASDHRFSNNLAALEEALNEALAWTRATVPAKS